MNLKYLHKDARKIEGILRLRTFLLAVKMLKRENEIPEEAERPLKEMGYHLDLC